MIICVIRKILPRVIFGRQIISCKIKEKACSAFIVIDRTDYPIKHALRHDFFDYKKCTYAKTTASIITPLIFRNLCIGEVCKKTRVWIHHPGIVVTFFSYSCPLGNVVFFVWFIHTIILIVDINNTFDGTLINLPFYLGYFDFEIIVHGEFFSLH